MSVSIKLRLAAASIVLAATAACSDPAPRSSAVPSVAIPPSTERGVNTPYYQGADPANQRPGMGARGGGT